MDTKKSIKPLLNMNNIIQCNKLHQVYNILRQQEKFVEGLHSALEVHGNVDVEEFLLDVRTYLCSQGTCALRYKRSHRRMSDYNMNKIELSNNSKQITTIIANQIVIAWNAQETTNSNIFNIIDKESNINEGDKNIVQIQYTTNKPNDEIKVHCNYCTSKKLMGKKHVHFIKEDRKVNQRELKLDDKEYNPIEKVFDKIDEMAVNNGIQTILHKPKDPPGKPIVQTNTYRMTYGDINYLGNNKALLYFNRGIRGQQIFTNSMYPLKQQPKYKDLIVLDDIVFTSTCRCDSYRQHQEMFPHYRVTCAAGLTCPAKLNSYEKISYARSRNASMTTITTARSMLIRYW